MKLLRKTGNRDSKNSAKPNSGLSFLDNSTKLNLSDFSNINKTLTKQILKSLKPENLIGEGAVGKVYLVDQKYVVKEVTPCVADPNSKLYEYCADILKIKDEIPNIPGGDGKIRYILPNLLSEILIGMIQGDMFSFTRTIGSILSESKDEVKVYIVMEYNQPLVKDQKISMKMDTKQFLIFLFQIAHGLFASQQKYKFTHYDLHIENLLWKYSSEEIRYSLPNFDLSLVVNSPVIFKMSDFGLARLETDTTMITPAVDKFPQNTYGEFSPSYDILSILGSICIANKYRGIFQPLFDKDPDLHRFMFMFLLWVLNDKEIQLSSDLAKTRDEIGNKYYTQITSKKNFFTFRPKTQGDFVKYSQAKSMVNIVNFLARVLIATNHGYLSNKPSTTIELGQVDSFSKVVLFSPKIPKSKKYVEVPIDESILLRSYRIVTKNVPKDYNFTISDKQIEYCPFQENYITAIFMKDITNYQFSFQCCKLDIANYLVDKNQSGFAINGGFFDIKGDYLPIGPYKDDYFQTHKHKIPKGYQDVFGHVLLENNQLRISRSVKNEKVLSTGPILIERGEIVFNPDDNRFTCTDSKTAGKTVIKERARDITVSGHYEYSSDNNTCFRKYVEDEQTYPRCDKIQPGELSHADNPNPRSALCILRDGTYVFLAVEGRGNRGIGMDLYTLSLTIKESFPDVVSAINLDGGRSSTLAWRTENDKTVYISNPDRDYVYPVGNILTCLKK